MHSIVVLLNRDLRLHDHPALADAARIATYVTPLFVLDDALLARTASPNRAGFLLESLADLHAGLAAGGGHLVVRRGDVVRETLNVVRAARAQALYATADVTEYGRDRERRLSRACAGANVEWRVFPGVTVLPAGAVTPSGGDHFKVFSAYWNRWRAAPRRPLAMRPRRLTPAAGVEPGRIPALAEVAPGHRSPDVVPGGESAGRTRLDGWLARGLARYDDRRNALAADATSHLSPYLHLGCVSPLEVVTRAEAAHASGFGRELCWRDFFHQVVGAFPAMARTDYRPRGDRWRRAASHLQAWTDGRTGYPIVDAGMRQLRAQGWMPNRARLLTASFLVKDLGIDWRRGARHFFDLLVDADVANNAGNWQWVAGTGNDTRPNRVFNPVGQARRFDPHGEYVRRWVPELASVTGPGVHEPWKLPAAERHRLDYPPPIVEHAAAVSTFLGARRAAAAKR